ncbi:hypothetical protein RND81_01G171900 [Saponaria officinalis]|uniref:F-box/LRR-repeat protein 15/At3g58940/PEG3-like LRR domain-containing protein n=1 Tax=Saponaria officinalis TaxID=3572 RepID=A0AAW1NJB6_SAPOF
MPTLDAVKTMLLRRFGNLWTLVPALLFDFEEYDGIIRPYKHEATIHEVFSSFARFVRNVLVLHKRPTIDSFHFSMKPYDVEIKDPKLIDDVQMWLRFPVDRQVKDLNFDLICDDDLVLPNCIFMSQSVTRLTLSGCIIEHQPQFHMGSLRELSLVDVEGSGQVYNQLILGCPSLQELNINSSHLSDVLNITSPSVGKLCLDTESQDDYITLSCPNMKNLDINAMVELIDVSSLQVVNINDLIYDDLLEVEAFLRQIRNVEVVTLSAHAFERLGFIQRDYPRNRWKRLVLHPCWDKRRCLQIIFELVAASVKLEDLIIHSEHSSGFVKARLFLPEISTRVILLLKTVTIHCNKNCFVGQLKLVELLLGNAVVLEKLVITFEKKQVTAVENNNFVEQVSRFRKASTNATVVFA